MIKITPDTNIFISATLVRGNEFRLLELAKEGKVSLVTSPQIFQEFFEVISREKFGFSPYQIEQACKQILGCCSIVLPKRKISIILADPDDNKILECALSAAADMIVSGDRHLLELKSFEGIPILNCKESLNLIFSKI